MADGPAGDPAGDASQLGRVDLAGGHGGMDAEFPADLIGHPIADAGEGGLVEEEGLDGGARAAVDHGGDVPEGERGVEDPGREAAPWILRAVVKLEASELPVIVEDEAVAGGPQNEVVVLLGGMVRRGGKETAGHAEVQLQVHLPR
jgi:hypothetical protein